MTEATSVDSVSVVLSREELLLILSLLEAESIPGLDTDPLGGLNEDGLALAFTVAGRGLRARGLAQENEEGELVILNEVLSAVGACAYSTNSLFVFHWPKGGEDPARYYGHVSGEYIASHTRPDPVLHLFSLLPSRQSLVDQILEFSEFTDLDSDGSLEIDVSTDDFVKVREHAFAGEKAAALGVLESADAGAANAFVDTLAESPSISVMQTRTRTDEETIMQRDFTLIQGGDQSWFVAPAAEGDAVDQLVIRSAGRKDVEAFLNEAL